MGSIAKLIGEKKYSEAITLIASDPLLQTQENLLSVSKSSDLAFSLLRFVPLSRNINQIIENAALTQRYARIIFEDIPELRTKKLFQAATGNDPSLAQHYLDIFKCDENWLTPDSRNSEIKHQNNTDLSI
ncbi:MAG: hypothetical protein NT000_01840 [Proteobacteria bacterium]|nr:hypothetical protein [Pseudomonadota bacterium]